VPQGHITGVQTIDPVASVCVLVGAMKEENCQDSGGSMRGKNVMEMSMRVCLASFLLFGSLVGCESPSSGRLEDSSVAESPDNASGAPVTYLDKESLHSGVGPMDKDASKEFQETESGLRYRILRAADGRKPGPRSYVEVNYRGWLNNGREFDSSYKRGETTKFPLDGVIPGWTEGLQLVSEGGMIELWIPSDLGYGSSGSPGSIPPNATLHFIVELVSIQ